MMKSISRRRNRVAQQPFRVTQQHFKQAYKLKKAQIHWKKLRSTREFKNDEVKIGWNIENVPVPRGFNPSHASKQMNSFLKDHGYKGRVTIHVRRGRKGEFPEEQGQQLLQSRVDFKRIESEDKHVTDQTLIDLLGIWERGLGNTDKCVLANFLELFRRLQKRKYMKQPKFKVLVFFQSGNSTTYMDKAILTPLPFNNFLRIA